MRTTCFSDSMGGIHKETPISRQKSPHSFCIEIPWRKIAPEGTWNQAARQEVTVDRMTHTCEKITLPQTLFTDGNYLGN